MAPPTSPTPAQAETLAKPSPASVQAKLSTPPSSGGRPIQRRTNLALSRENVRSTEKRSGRQLWAVARARSAAFHHVRHELEHRAKEKAFFGVAEHVVGRVAFFMTADHLAHGAEAAATAAAAGGRKLARTLRADLRRAGRWVRRAAGRLAVSGRPPALGS